MIPLSLVALAAVLAGVAPRLMARQPCFRRAPRAALVAWQAVTLGAIVASLAAAPAAFATFSHDTNPSRNLFLLTLAIVTSGGMALRLLWSGHRVGRRLRTLRAQHRELVDIIARPDHERVRVLAHPTPTAYCIPGRHSRVVLSQGMLDAMPPEQLDAVIAHEDAHLRARHDLLVEFFTVVHSAVPGVLRSEEALVEVRLLVEALADRAAVRTAGEVSTARALVRLARSRTPEAALGAGTTASTRLRLLADGPPPLGLSVVAYTYAAGACLLPVALAASAWR
ncbi:MAG: M56 family metallopeptidase [Ornithinibacter sp.]